MANRSSGLKRSLTRSKAAPATSIAISAEAKSGCLPSSSERKTCAVRVSRATASVINSSIEGICDGACVSMAPEDLSDFAALPYRRFANHTHEILVHAAVAAQFGVERGRQDVLLADHYGVAVALCERLNRRPRALDPRRANVNCRKILAAQLRDF